MQLYKTGMKDIRVHDRSLHTQGWMMIAPATAELPVQHPPLRALGSAHPLCSYEWPQACLMRTVPTG